MNIRFPVEGNRGYGPNYLDPMNFTLTDSLIKALQDAKAESKRRYEDNDQKTRR